MTLSLPQVKKPQGLTPTSIEWADFAFNPLRAIDRETGKVGWACIHVSEGCRNCYAEAINRRFGTGQPFTAQGMANVEVVLDEQRVGAALRWRVPRGFVGKAGDGRPKVFVADMTDAIGQWVTHETLDRLFALFALRPDIDWMVLTKRPERMAEYLGDRTLRLGAKGQLAASTHERVVCAASAMISDNDDRQDAAIEWPLPNVWLLTSAEDQPTLDARVKWLLQCDAAVRGLSLEPLLGGIDLSAFMGGEYVALPGDRTEPNRNFGIDWIITGGESGPGARPCNVEWIRSIVSQCGAADVPCFVKQLGSKPYDPAWHGDGSVEGSAMLLNDSKGGDPAEWPEDLRVRQWPKGGAA